MFPRWFINLPSTLPKLGMPEKTSADLGAEDMPVVAESQAA